MRFHIRDLLLATLIVAVAVGWWIDHAALKRKVHLQQVEIVEWQERAVEFAVKGDRMRSKGGLPSVLPNGGFPQSRTKGSEE